MLTCHNMMSQSTVPQDSAQIKVMAFKNKMKELDSLDVALFINIV